MRGVGSEAGGPVRNELEGPGLALEAEPEGGVE